jgi:hypothetical protein
LACAGCKDADQIRSYQVPKVRQDPPRLLTAMIPTADKVWFIKLTGAEPAVAAERAIFDQFLSSVKFTDASRSALTWTLPTGWREAGGKTSTRFATLRAGPEALEVSISSLGREASDVKSNVNRWRGQIGLKPVANDGELEAICQKITVDGEPGTLIDMTGSLNEPVAMAPHPTVPKDDVHSKSQPPPPTTARKPITYEVPKGWTEIPATGMRVAAFRVSDGGQSTEITVIPLSGPAGGLLGNVNRWRKEVGLPDTTEDVLKKESKSIDIDGVSAVYVDLAGQEKRNLGVLFPRDGQTWFIKFQAPNALIEKERANFEAFAKSIRFAPGGGS